MTDAGTYPSRQLWAEALRGDPAELSSNATPLLRKDEPVAYIGGKLAAALIAPLAAAGFPAVVADRRHPALADIAPEEAEYEAFGHGYGEVHTAREFRQLVERAARTFAPTEDRWREGGRVIDPFRPGLRYTAASDQEFDVLQERHLNAVRAAIRRARTVVVALSQSEIWESKADGAVFPRWTSAAEAHFDPETHAVRALTVEETVLDLAAAVRALRTLNPELTIVLMVSPEPQLATTHPAHVQVAGTLGKAVLRIAIEAVVGADGIIYFPALEIAGLETPGSAYAADGTLPEQVIAAITGALTAVSEGGSASVAEAGAPVRVLRTIPSEPRAPRRPKAEVAPAAETVETAAAAPAQAPGKKAKRQAKSKPVELSVVDPYTQAKAAEAKDKAQRRAAHLKEIGEEVPPMAELEKPTLSLTERKVARREKALAREAKLAAEASTPDTAVTTKPKRAVAAGEEAPVVAAPSTADTDDAAKTRRKLKKQRKAEQAGTPDPVEAAVNPRRERKRAAKG